MQSYNFSGHPVVGFDHAPFIGLNFGKSADEILKVVQQTLQELPKREMLLQGEQAEIILPGLSQIAGILLAQWHGQFGNWPFIRWAVRDDSAGAFVYPESAIANLNLIRESARFHRTDS